MNQFKKAQVVILPAENKGEYNSLLFHNNKLIQAVGQTVSKIISYLYIISDDEIKDGDWYINVLQDNAIYQNNIKDYNVNKSYLKKIIATTDNSLLNSSDIFINVHLGEESLPQPSQQFIEKYIEEYNKGNVIKNVLVEEIFPGGTNSPWKLKINPKDNTITIKKLKDNWNKEEVIELLRFAFQSQIKSISRQEDWIEENL